MPCLIGIDEAGYGPNLGPFVMSMASLEAPDELVDANLWKVLSKVVRRSSGAGDKRLVVDDSKAIFAASQGLVSLEGEILPFLWDHAGATCCLETYWAAICISKIGHLQKEPWYAAGWTLPRSCPYDDWAGKRARLQTALQTAGIGAITIRSVVIFPRLFNKLLARSQSKASAPLTAIRELMAWARRLAPAGDHHVHVDKLGGRNFYHEFLQNFFTDGLVLTRQESGRCSHYQVTTPAGRTTIRFEPEFDSRSFVVALASMASKYLREVLMEQFNAFWQRHVPDIRPTAGYPGDAKRFYDGIAAVRARLGIADEVLWRAR